MSYIDELITHTFRSMVVEPAEKKFFRQVPFDDLEQLREDLWLAQGLTDNWPGTDRIPEDVDRYHGIATRLDSVVFLLDALIGVREAHALTDDEVLARLKELKYGR
jgi:hypothetical protein